MLRHLTIRDFVIVDRLELEFGPGFTVLTGETGAGKSILIDALTLALGGRAESGVVRAGAERAEVVAEFDIGTGTPSEAWLAESGLAADPGVCLLRRVVESGGRSRAFINGSPVTLQQLKELGEALVEIHGQHAHQSLGRPEVQRRLLDGYGATDDLATAVAAAWRDWRALRERREALERDAARIEAERETLAWQVKELEGLGLAAGEWESLSAEHTRLAHAASLLEGARFGLDTLSEGEGALLGQLNALQTRISSLAAYDPALGEVSDLLGPAEIQLSEASRALRHYLSRVDLDPERLAQTEARLDAAHSLARKHRVQAEALPALLTEKAARLAELSSGADPAELERRETEARARYAAAAKRLTAARNKAATTLGKAVSEAMQGLAMAGGTFEVALLPLEGGGLHGDEAVEFRVAAHPGVEPRPVAKVASGGELSRIGLALQVILARVGEVPTLIFDEVDSGIGGGVAEIVGRLLRRLGGERQVMCITHLPQVAATANAQWRVAKESGKAGVKSRVEELAGPERVEEIARMLGGVSITATTRRHAEEMLAGAAPAGG